ncbi:MAG TPA: PIN domain-containing protein [Candidatus Hydrogenedentes bacterium]|nr:PIN domain-containing protein [Candidatus Hydrogenedentota bacterium]HPG66929.1 PIN domain-containing protein [Candidatus Hydrogenedentota bacterium]
MNKHNTEGVEKGRGALTLKIVRVLFVLACLVMGVIWARYVLENWGEPVVDFKGQFPWIALGGVVGGAIAVAILGLLGLISQEFYEKLSPLFLAVVMAMVVGYFMGQYILWWWPEVNVTLRVYVIASLVLLFGFIGISLGMTRASNWESIVEEVSKRTPRYGSPKLVDTSVIIDGRIADVWESGFIEGTLIVPRFVLQELQHIADSPDVLRRAKGRRGLDILKTMQESKGRLNLVVVDDNPAGVREVDGKLVAVARAYGAKIITNDYNLNKVAQIEGVDVLNLNDLANAVKPAVLPDERMEIKIVKEGKEAMQGVGYLDDGTMVVVDGGKHYVGNNVNVIVTSVLQTSAGRMIFGKLGDVIS